MRSAPIVCPEESPLPASVYDNYAVRRFAAGGLVRRLWLGSGIWCPMGFSPASVPEGFQRASGKPLGEPAGAYPLPRVGTDAPTTAREWDLPSYGALTLFFRWRKKSVQKKASGTATPEAAHVAMRRGLRSAGALRAVLDLGSLRSPAGKKPFTAHFDGGARNVARNLVGQLTPSPVRAPVLTFFRRQNERAFFPSLPIAARFPRSWRWADSNGGA